MFPSGATISLSAVGASITLPGDVVGGLKAGVEAAVPGSSLTSVGIGGGLIAVDATNATPASEVNSSSADITAANQTITGYNPTGSLVVPGAPTADPLTFNIAGPIPYPNFTSSGANGQTATFETGSTGSGFVLSLGGTGLPISAIGAGVLNAFPPGPGPGNCATDALSPPTAAFASTNLVDPAPTANPQDVNLGIHGGPKSITLTASDPDTTPANDFEIVSPPDDPRLTATVTNASTGATDLTDSPSGVGPATVHFTFKACDAAAPGPHTNCSAPATVTVHIGTPPVDQLIQQNVIGAQLVLSCNSPDVYVPGSALLTCPTLGFNDVTLNGTQQTVSTSAKSIYVSDNRGDPSTNGWSLTASMVPTPGNPNSSCAGLTDFCNSDSVNVGSNVLRTASNGSHPGQIESSNLSIDTLSCDPVLPGNLNPAGTVGAGGAFGGSAVHLCTAPQYFSGGTFKVDGTYHLVVPDSIYQGLYMGTVEYLVT